MTTVPAFRREIPASTPCLASSMSPEECAEHRSRIGFEVKLVLGGYFQAAIPAELEAGMMADWADELENWSVDQVRWGLRDWRRRNPRIRPNPGDILAVLIDRRGRAAAERTRLEAEAEPVPMRQPPSPDVCARRAAILQDLLSQPGFIKRIA